MKSGSIAIGSVVKVGTDGMPMKVIGYSSEGLILCQGYDENNRLRSKFFNLEDLIIIESSIPGVDSE